MPLNPVRVPISYKVLPDKTIDYITHILKHSDDVIADMAKLNSKAPESLQALISALLGKLQDLAVLNQMVTNSGSMYEDCKKKMDSLKEKLDIARSAVKKLDDLPRLLNTRLMMVNKDNYTQDVSKVVDVVTRVIEAQIEKALQGLTDAEWSEREVKHDKIYKSIPVSPNDLYFEGKPIGDNEDDDTLDQSIKPF